MQSYKKIDHTIGYRVIADQGVKTLSVLSLDHVSRQFGSVAAVTDLSFSVEPGKIYGFLGPNGAGKTTSLRMILGIIPPSQGTINLFGKPISRASLDKIGFLAEERGLYRTMTVIDTIIYFGTLKGMSSRDARRAGHEILERFSLGEVAKRRIDTLSKGNAQKIQLATALVHNPELLLLDEPFSGLDPVNQNMLESAILDMIKAGGTVMFSTHVMAHADRLCDRFILLRRGHMVFDGTSREARDTIPPRLILVGSGEPGAMPGVVRSCTHRLPNGETHWDLDLMPGADHQAIIAHCLDRGMRLSRFSPYEPTLHEIFVHLVGPDGIELADPAHTNASGKL